MNYGFDEKKELLDISDEDYIFGSDSDICLAVIDQDLREKYLPKGEVQKGKDDTMDCVTRAFLNILETKFNYLLDQKKIWSDNEKWLRDNGYITEYGFEFSDAFIAILSGTTKGGNSMKAVAHAIHEHGLIPKRFCPLEQWMRWEDYHNKERITGSLLALGEQFKERFPLFYERVVEEAYDILLKEDMIVVAGYAWSMPKNGEYPRTEKEPNHAFVAYKTPRFFIFDNYIDSTDGDFVKKLAKNYALKSYGYRIYVTQAPLHEEWKINAFPSLFKKLAFLKDILKLFTKKKL